MHPALPIASQSRSTRAGAVTLTSNPFSAATFREPTYHPATVTVPDLKLV